MEDDLNQLFLEAYKAGQRCHCGALTSKEGCWGNGCDAINPRIREWREFEQEYPEWHRVTA